MGPYITAGCRRNHQFVMAGLDSALHVFASKKKDVDARDKRGHDVERFAFEH
jgi:hypothetical protein